MTHTPGPWLIKGPSEARNMHVGGDFAIYVVTDAPHIIAETFDRSPPTDRHPAEANARLMAAAPDMRAALEFYLETEPGAAYRKYHHPADVAIVARAAIAKATEG